MAQETDLRAIAKIRRLMQTFRSSIDENAPVQVVQTFLLVCENEGKGVAELADLGSATRTTMSRHLLNLSERLRNGSDGYQLLKRVTDPSDMRAVSYILTNKGKALRNSLIELMEE